MPKHDPYSEGYDAMGEPVSLLPKPAEPRLIIAFPSDRPPPKSRLEQEIEDAWKRFDDECA